MAKLKDGFYKQTAESVGSNSYVLLAGGGSKPLSDFATNSVSGNYVTLDTAQIISGVKIFNAGNIPIKLNSTGNEVGIQFLLNDTAKGWVGHTNTTGTYIYNYPSAKYIGVKDDGTPYYYSEGFKTLLHSGNYADYTVKKDGTGASGTWGIDISGNSNSASRLKSTRYDANDPSPNTTIGVTFQFSYLASIGWHNVLTMKSYEDNNYTAAQLITPAGNPGKDSDYSGNMRWRQGRNSTWLDWKVILDSSNWTSYISIPTVTNYYWANIPISATSSTSTSPTFLNVYANGNAKLYGQNVITSFSTQAPYTDVWSDGTNSHPWYGYDHRYTNTGVFSTTLSDYYGMTLRTASVNISMTLDNVGIGTYSPENKLDVNLLKRIDDPEFEMEEFQTATNGKLVLDKNYDLLNVSY